MITLNSNQGTSLKEVTQDQKDQSSLEVDGLRELAEVGLKAENEFGGLPQDIEWAIAGGKLWLLQSRPITHLPPPPPKNVSWPEIPNVQLLKRQVAENMPDPLSPLFQDLYLKGLFDSQKWPKGWKWEGIHTKNWMIS